MGPKEVLKLCREQEVKIVDIRFMDFPGLWQHFSIPASRLTEEMFDEGLAFDGSSIRGWQSIHESDMMVQPDASTAFIDPFMQDKTLVLISNVKDPITKKDYPRDPRNIARKAEAYMKSTGIADTAFFGPELEFFIFDNIQFEQKPNSAFYFIDSVEGFWNSGKDEGPNLGYKPRYKEGYFPVPPMDSMHDIRSQIMLTLEKLGLAPEIHHHEVATAGQSEIGIRYAPLVQQGDGALKFKYIVKNIARRHGKTATFMPKPLFGDNGSGMHTHISLWKGDKNLFFGDGYADLSDTALYAIGGILKHAPALLALTNPTTNSYKRLVPGYEAPVRLAYSSRNRSAAVRIPVHGTGPKGKRFEFRCPDSTSNPYLAFSAILMAALDGIQNKMDPGEPLDKNIYDLPPEILKEVPSTPGSLELALDNLERDHAFLLKGDVFTREVIETWIAYKRASEVDALRLRPHPYEFALYFDI